MVIGIIGGGASGMMAAIAAAKNKKAEIYIFERQARVGKKLSATGNGRCNLTNCNPAPYGGEDPTFAQYALSRYSPGEMLGLFGQLGLYTVIEESGRVYPYSDQANSVVDVLRLALDKENITVYCGCEVEQAVKAEDGFRLKTAQGTYFCHKLIVACGGIAGTKLGGTMSGYRLLGGFGHKTTRLRPSLVQLTSHHPALPSLKGVRANANVKIYREDTLFAESTGEIQFTDKGLSGPVIFEISRDVCEGRGTWTAKLDLLPMLSNEKLVAMLTARKNTNLTTDELFTGILHNRLGRVITKEAGVGFCPISYLSEQELRNVAHYAKCFTAELTGTLGMDGAQVTAGGVYTKDFDPETMESRRIPGLYACGEVLDIDGPCGGYNLQWAWSSGFLAGESAGRENV
ncbi:MAG: aminoacetone oxidase family FAD-binding enzyme [Oscillospiraceae bacterium]|nr:aminoacetone oxidase family FAD-binding enzyme [Oscillospiraceae bacterium]